MLKKSKLDKKSETRSLNSISSIAKRMLTTREAAAYLGASYSQLKDSRSSGKLWSFPQPKYKQMGPKTIRYDIHLLDEWLDAIPDDIYTGEQPAQLKVVSK